MKLRKVFIGLLAITLVVFSASLFAQGTECKDIEKIFDAQGKSVKESDVYESANVCAVCHDTIYKEWKSGLMGQTQTSPIYQKFLAEAVKTRGDSVKGECNLCHMPTFNKSDDPSDELLAQGVNCDFCHTIENVEFHSYPGSYISSPGRVKKAALEIAKSPYHPSTTTEVLENPRFCAACHQYTMSVGSEEIIVEDTYTQYRDSSYGRTNKGCLACHMPNKDRKVANLDLAPLRQKTHSHEFAYPDKEKYISNAVILSIKPYMRKATDITVICNNKAQGHAFPGGANYFRHLILTIYGYNDDGQQIWSYSHIFGRWYEDKFGSKTYFPWMANKIRYNNLLRPDRIENVLFKLTEKIRVYNVVAVMDYWYMPPELVKKYNLAVEPIRVAKTSRRPDDY